MYYIDNILYNYYINNIDITMKEIIFNKKIYNVPTCWQEVTLGMLMRVSEYESMIDDAPIVSIIAGYTGIDVTQLKTSKVQEVQEIMEILEFIYTPYAAQPTNEFTFNGITYAAEPDLSDQKFGDWVAIQTILYNHRENPVRGLPYMLAVYCKKYGETLDDFNVEERQKMFSDVPMTTGKDVEGFFLSFQMALRSLTLISSTEKELEGIVLNKFLELSDTMKKRSQEPGTSLRMKLWILIYRKYLLYLRKQLEASFNSKVTELSKKNFLQIWKELATKRFAGSPRVSMK